MENRNIQPPTESTPFNRSQKIVTRDYVGDTYSCAKFGAHPSTVTFGRMGEIYWTVRPLYFVAVSAVVSIFLLSFSFFFPRLISAVADWMSTILLHVT